MYFKFGRAHRDDFDWYVDGIHSMYFVRFTFEVKDFKIEYFFRNLLVITKLIQFRYKNDDILDENKEDSSDSICQKLFRPKLKQPTVFSSTLVNGLTFLSILCIIIASFLLSKANMQSWYAILILVVVLIFLVPSIFIIWCQPQVTNIDTFKVRFITLLAS